MDNIGVVKQRIVYILRSKKDDDDENFYIRSTPPPLRHRLSTHKEDSKRTNSDVSMWIREVGGDGLMITPLFVNKCDEETIKRTEHGFIQKLRPNLNKIGAFLSKEERAERNPINSREYSRKFEKEIYEKRREYLKKYSAKRVTCEACGYTVSQGNIAQHRKSKRHIEKNFLIKMRVRGDEEIVSEEEITSQEESSEERN